MMSSIIFIISSLGLTRIFHPKPENQRFLEKKHSDDNPRLPGRGLFFSEIARPRIFGTCFMISEISGHEKDAESDLEKGPPSFSP